MAALDPRSARWLVVRPLAWSTGEAQPTRAAAATFVSKFNAALHILDLPSDTSCQVGLPHPAVRRLTNAARAQPAACMCDYHACY